MIQPHQGAGRATVRRPRRPRVALASAVLVATLLTTGLFTTGCTTDRPAAGSPSQQDVYGALPTFLPADHNQADSEIIGTAVSPAVTSQGDSVKVQLGPDVFVHATVGGPDVPGEGLPYESDATTCTWTFTLTGATAVVPVDVADFTAADHLGNVYHLHAFAGHPIPPTSIRPGQQLTFQLQAVMPTGEGLMRWAPHHSVLASWDFEVEND